MDLKWPTWEAAKELADKLPGQKSGTKGDEPKCETCGTPIDEQNQKEKR